MLIGAVNYTDSCKISENVVNKSIERFRGSIVLSVVLIILNPFGCSRDAPPTDSHKPEVPQPASVSTEGFSFIYKGPVPTTFSEAPELAKRVAAGELPPIEDRLPEEPLIVPPIERIGQYGGTWRRGFTGRADRNNFDRLIHDHLIYYDLDGYTLVPHIAKAWDISENGTTFTFHLRPGMKWSDGAPFTADDFVFAFEDVTLNENINPVIPSYSKADGQLYKVEKLDETTVRYTFHKPNYMFIENVGGLAIGGQFTRLWFCPLYAPRHYLMQFLPKYTPLSDLNNKMKSSGDKSWVQLFKRMSSPHENFELPVVGPWKMVTPITSDIYSLERNPYYFAVDPKGNQLPYIDKIVSHLVEDLEVFNARVMAGEVDMQHRHVMLDKIPVLKREAVRGNYRVLIWPNSGGTDAAIIINQTWQGDPEIEKWLRNRDFRIALSLAIDREEINESIFLGMGNPRAYVAIPNNPYYPGPEYEKKYAVRDLDKANEILNKLGLNKRDRAGYRLRADNKERLIITLSVLSQAMVNFEGIAELLVNHWKDIGIHAHLSIEERSYHSKRHSTNEHQLSMWVTGGTANPWTSGTLTCPIASSGFAPLIGSWYLTQGQKGVAPTGDLKRLLEIFEEGNSLPREMRTDLGKELWRIHVDNLFMIGTVGQSPAMNGVVVVKNYFRNVPDVAPNSSALQNPGIARTEQFFFDRGGTSN